jgi:hypothetical protein
MKSMIPITLLMALLAACHPGTPQKQQATDQEGTTDQEDEWIQLFNGKDLEGWVIKIAKHPLGENFNHTFRVENGLLLTRYDQYEKFDGEFGHLFYQTPYSRYKLRLEYRIVGEQVNGGEDWAYKNSGVMFHAQSPGSMGIDQSFPVCVEAQLLGGKGEGDRPTGNLCTPGTHVVMNGELVTDHCISSSSKTYHGEEWVTFELVVYGDSIIHHLVDGDTVITYSRPQIGGEHLPEDYPIAEGTPLSSGYIALQAESHPFEFRKVELQVLDR